jgi:hypothetical protein
MPRTGKGPFHRALRSTVALAATGAAVYGVVAATTGNAEVAGTQAGTVQTGTVQTSTAQTGTALTGTGRTDAALTDWARQDLAADVISLPGKTAVQPGLQAAARAAKAATAKKAPVKTGAVKTGTIKTAAKTASAKPAASAKPVSKPKVTSISCSPASGLLPANVSAIVTFLVHHGYSGNAAAGIAGNIYQESKGNPESAGMGGGGLIGFTPLPGGYETGNVGADLQTQLNAVLSFNQQWSSYLPELNAASSAAAAAKVYVEDFERAGMPEASTREASAQAVASACGL